MKPVSLKMSIVIIVCLFVLPPIVDSASAHRVNVFAWVEGDTVYVESKFQSGKKVKGGKIRVYDAQGNELLSGLTNDAGEFSFKAPGRLDLKIELNAGQAHLAEWTIHASELQDLPSQVAPQTSAEETNPPEGSESVSKPMKIETAALVTDQEPAELETIIETVLDRKLKPITKMLADMQQDAPTVKDIFAGVGYILGLVGIAAYIHSRKKNG